MTHLPAGGLLSNYPSQHVPTCTHNQTFISSHPHQIAAASQQGSIRNWGPEQIGILVPSTQYFGYPRITHLTHPTRVQGQAPPAQVATASGGYECAWLVRNLRCGGQFATFAELVVHLGQAHEARGTAQKLLICQWDDGGGPCLSTFRRDNVQRHIRSHFRIRKFCEACGKSYSRADSLKKHVKNYHLGR
ncbi:hypothetical protein PAXRUDRAFT_831998 [Paxillus rubicundulus Ve08.2h10]|uniref:C2H2-type domain-containing protein n=1 Tax=Paxillus rubicundulus Ve08.2h10 TaxID=930991 RepID=A0A0D0DUF6_9AGAM|nr:hypothetical protein PAXRUDRAFT_831998 [Paxillus rubicundulus Ve08.2h10]